MHRSKGGGGGVYMNLERVLIWTKLIPFLFNTRGLNNFCLHESIRIEFIPFFIEHSIRNELSSRNRVEVDPDFRQE